MNESYQRHRVSPVQKAKGRGTLSFVTGKEDKRRWLATRPVT